MSQGNSSCHCYSKFTTIFCAFRLLRSNSITILCSKQIQNYFVSVSINLNNEPIYHNHNSRCSFYRTSSYPMDMTKTRNGLENGLANRLERTCLKRSFGHRNPLYSEHTTRSKPLNTISSGFKPCDYRLTETSSFFVYLKAHFRFTLVNKTRYRLYTC